MAALGKSPSLKVEVMCEGIRYSEALVAAVPHSMPNFYPYRFKQGEYNPTGKDTIVIPYMIHTQDETMMRVHGNGDSPFHIEGSFEKGYQLVDDRKSRAIDVKFLTADGWLATRTSDGFPMVNAGVQTHGDMLVINVAPGCEYFLHKHDGKSMRCSFCAYGSPDHRTAHLGQVAGQVAIPPLTLSRMLESAETIVRDTQINHIYLVGGSLTDTRAEGERFLQLARAVRARLGKKVPVTLGSGAVPDDIIEQFHHEDLVDAVCFNLEVWSERMFAQVCPGKNRYVGYHRWIAALETAVRLWGRGRVYSAMVSGIELEPEYNVSWEQAVATELEGAEDLCSRGIIPVYSLMWPSGGKERPDYHQRLYRFFETLNVGYADIRRRHGLEIWDGFMCHRCAYMQLECDIDRSPEWRAAAQSSGRAA